MKTKLIFLSIALLGASMAQADWVESVMQKFGYKRVTAFDTLVQKSCEFKDTISGLCHAMVTSEDFQTNAQATGALGLGAVGAYYGVKAFVPFFDKEKKWKDVAYPAVIAAATLYGSWLLGTNVLQQS